MRKASFSVEKATSFTDAHNTREHAPKYLLGCEQDNPNVYIKYYDYDEFQTLAENRYVEVNNQKMQQKQKEALFEEALISLEKHHTEKDIEDLFKSLNKKYTGHTLLNLAIHRDEGHFVKDGIEYYPTKHILQKDDGWYILDENDVEILQALQDKDFKPKNEDFKVKVNINDFEKVYNYHAHAVFSRFDLDLGKSARLQKKDMSERYKFVAEQMNMKYAPDESRFVKKSINQYKTDKSNSRNERLILKKQLETEHQKELEKLRDENKSLKMDNEALKAENQDLKIDNEALKYSKKELEDQIKDLSKNLRETLKELGALRPQYAQLEQLNKNLNEDLKNKVLDHEKVVKSYQDLEKNLKEQLTKKDEKIDNLAAENKDLKSELEELKEKLQLAEKRSSSYFGLNKELKEEIIALKSQINDLEAQNDTLTDKVIDLEEKIIPRANIEDFDMEDIDFNMEDIIEKDERLEKMINQVEKNTTSKNKLLDKFAEVDKKLNEDEPQEPTKNRSGRKNR